MKPAAEFAMKLEEVWTKNNVGGNFGRTI